jgi:predicted TIM-barrel fold metal-dependent hydrolase
MSYLVIDFHIHPKRSSQLIIDEILEEMDISGVSHGVLLGKDFGGSIKRPEIKNWIREAFLKSDVASHYWPNGVSSRSFSQLEEAWGELEYYLKERASSSPTSLKELAEIVNTHPGKFTGFGSINVLKDEEYVTQKLRELNTLRLKGLKIWPFLFNPSENENLRIVCEDFEKRRKILLVHTGCGPGPWEIPELAKYCNPKYLEPLAKDFNDLPIVLAHSGYYSRDNPGIFFKDALELSRKHENVWLEVSAVPDVVTDPILADKVKDAIGGFDRVLFGSDYLEYMQITVHVIKKARHLRDEDKAKILGLNAKQLLGL